MVFLILIWSILWAIQSFFRFHLSIHWKLYKMKSCDRKWLRSSWNCKNLIQSKSCSHPAITFSMHVSMHEQIYTIICWITEMRCVYFVQNRLTGAICVCICMATCNIDCAMDEICILFKFNSNSFESNAFYQYILMCTSMLVEESNERKGDA